MPAMKVTCMGLACNGKWSSLNEFMGGCESAGGWEGEGSHSGCLQWAKHEESSY